MHARRASLSLLLVVGTAAAVQRAAPTTVARAYVDPDPLDVEGAGRACGGPCDYATEPTGVDRSFMFDVTLNFGR